jgi:uncharacterized membrane protein
VDVLGVKAGVSTLVLMIETPYTLHTHSRSTLYIYNIYIYKGFQHLLQGLVVIRIRCWVKARSRG